MEKIAVVGISCLFPGAKNIYQFTSNIMEKRESIIDVPENRWILSPDSVVSKKYEPDTACSLRAGLITDFKFDPTGFNIDRDLIAKLDPLHKMVLDTGRKAAAQCYCTKETKKRTGVILASISLPTEKSSQIAWEILLQNNPAKLTRADALAASVVSMPAAILARAMGFFGGCYTLDAACASSLYSIKLACDELSLNRADMMICGGVSRPDSMYTQIGFTQLQALSSSGKCSPFDKNADGLVVGEGAGIIVLKRLSDAVSCGDKIYGVISGAGLSNDIAGNLVAPASEGQIRAMENAYKNAAWSPCDIQVMECHGSGTIVGDLVETSSIKAIWEKGGSPDKKNKILSIGSIKSMTGHLLTAAGAAGMIKTLVAMEKKLLPPSLNFSSLPDNSPLRDTLIKVQREPEEWIPDSLYNDRSSIARRAAVSAFGFGGINAHILVEEFNKKNHKQFFQTSKSIIQKKQTSQNADAGDTDHTRDADHAADAGKIQIAIAIVGMEVITGTAENLKEFKDLLLQDKNKTLKKSENWINEISTYPGEFHIPPNQINDILPQHLIMLKAAKGALLNAGIKPRPEKNDPARTKFGAAIGIEFDYGATDFYLRWKTGLVNDDLKDSVSPPLNSSRTLGALGGIAASRIAREFHLGGPCFTVSANSASGIKALDAGVKSLRSGETDIFICGAVDMAGDPRQQALDNSCSGEAVPSEGAAAVILKPLDQAKKDGNRIYGIIKGIGASSGGELFYEDTDGFSNITESYLLSLKRSIDDANIPPSSIGLYQTHADRNTLEKSIETRVIKDFFGNANASDCSFATVSASTKTGKFRELSGLLSLIKGTIALYHKTIPLDSPCFWEQKSPIKRSACIASMTSDGACSHVIIEEFPQNHAKSKLDEKNIALDVKSKNQINEISIKVRKCPLDTGLLNKLSVPGSADNSVSAYKPVWDSDPAPAYKSEPSPEPVSVPENALEPVPEQTHEPEAVSEQNYFSLPGMDKTRSAPDKKESDRPHCFNAVDEFHKAATATATAHNKFLDLSRKNVQAFEKQFKSLTRLASICTENCNHNGMTLPDKLIKPLLNKDVLLKKKPLFTKEMCMEFATGLAANVLGDEFKIIDTYQVRVRLPDAPLMLVDRIMSIEGEMLSLKSGKIVTHHDVKEGAWYLDGNKAPVSISIEAGQADLFLSSYLGIDHRVKGKRSYRLLDAKVTFHRSLPEPDETLEYRIEIDRFLKQGDVYLFFFHYKGYIDEKLFISMRDGCAGFFTDKEVKNSGGIILKNEDKEIIKNKRLFNPHVSVKKEKYSDEKIEALRRGDLEACFGNEFKDFKLGKNLRLPGGRMHLIDRVTEFDPFGGRFKLGSITAEADIYPDSWFLICHFTDDMVMPGTLMYECCAHALRIFTQRMGWVTKNDNAYYDIIPDLESDLKCRGPVTPQTKKAGYYIEIKEMGYNPEPYVIADAHMFSDDHRIVFYKNMGIKISGLSLTAIDSWRSY